MLTSTYRIGIFLYSLNSWFKEVNESDATLWRHGRRRWKWLYSRWKIEGDDGKIAYCDISGKINKVNGLNTVNKY